MPHHTHRTRLPAEWEPQAATLLTWPHQNTDWNKNIGDADTVYTTLSNTISQHQPLIIVTTDDNHRQHIETLLHLSTQPHQYKPTRSAFTIAQATTLGREIMAPYRLSNTSS